MGIAVVTGANSGIGLATTIRLAQDGHEVYGAMRDLDKAGSLRDACIEAGVDSVNLLRIDVTNDHVIELAFRQVRKQSGPVDILVNNAGIAQSRAIEDAPLEMFEQHLDANFLGAVRCIKAVLPSMRERATGHIVNVSSAAGRFAQVTMGAYTASKFALEGLTEVLAQEVAAYGIRVSLIEPGTIRTPIFAKGDAGPAETFYPMHYERSVGYFAKTLIDAPGPELVAKTISQAIVTDEPKLRYPVADDAHALIAGRHAMTDEELVALGALSTEEWYAAFHERFGLDLRA
ncbi:MAG: SDR family oxidoreductase [Actinobacteria bacterium]|nr:SDR family oxidoreductase [Actinomycetota bacterium]